MGQSSKTLNMTNHKISKYDKTKNTKNVTKPKKNLIATKLMS